MLCLFNSLPSGNRGRLHFLVLCGCHTLKLFSEYSTWIYHVNELLYFFWGYGKLSRGYWDHDKPREYFLDKIIVLLTTKVPTLVWIPTVSGLFWNSP